MDIKLHVSYPRVTQLASYSMNHEFFVSQSWLKLQEYPNDEQWCNIILEIDGHRSRAVDLRLQKSNRKKQDIKAPGTFDVRDYKLKKRRNCIFVSLGVTRVMSHQHLQVENKSVLPIEYYFPQMLCC